MHKSLELMSSLIVQKMYSSSYPHYISYGIPDHVIKNCLGLISNSISLRRAWSEFNLQGALKLKNRKGDFTFTGLTVSCQRLILTRYVRKSDLALVWNYVLQQFVVGMEQVMTNIAMLGHFKILQSI